MARRKKRITRRKATARIRSSSRRRTMVKLTLGRNGTPMMKALPLMMKASPPLPSTSHHSSPTSSILALWQKRLKGR